MENEAFENEIGLRPKTQISMWRSRVRALGWALKWTTVTARYPKSEPFKPQTEATGENKTLLIFHAYYPDVALDMLSSFCSRLKALDLVLTFPVGSPMQTYSESLRDAGYQKIQFLEVPNVGRNVGALFEAVRHFGQDYDIILHAHTKVSPHASQKKVKSWLNSLLTIFRSESHFDVMMNSFLDPNVCLVSSDLRGTLPARAFTWAFNASHGRKLCSEFNLDFPAGSFYFPAGAMFGFRLRTYEQLISHILSSVSFPPEPSAVDGEPQHAIERLFGILASQRGINVVLGENGQVESI